LSILAKRNFMSIILKSHNNESCYTQIIVVDKLDKLDSYLSQNESLFIKERLKDADQAEMLDENRHLIVAFKKDKCKDKVRRLAHSIHSKITKYNEVNIQLADPSSLEFIEGLYLSNYQFLKYFKDKAEKKSKLENVSVSTVSQDALIELSNELAAVEWARDLVNEPLSYLTAPQLSAEIEVKGQEASFKVDVFNKAKIESLKMGGLLAVNKGSVVPPTFTVMEWKPANAVNSKPIVLVGKGIVYDTGGLSLKPTAHSMDIMKSDMGGAACMAGAIYAIAKNKIPVHVIGLIPATDNRPGGDAYAPGDVINMYDGTTIEVLNTDAEGRMVLADALAYGNQFEPELMIDAATLTGAAVRAIGTKASVNMGNASDEVFKIMEESGAQSGDRVVRLPFWDEYKEELKSDIADMKNLGGPNAGMITAGKFLEHFAKFPYVHVDIAGPAFLEAPDSYRGKGGTGAGVRLIYNFVKNYSKK
jgi:leucyl aminopeptidase